MQSTFSLPASHLIGLKNRLHYFHYHMDHFLPHIHHHTHHTVLPHKNHHHTHRTVLPRKNHYRIHHPYNHYRRTRLTTAHHTPVNLCA